MRSLVAPIAVMAALAIAPSTGAQSPARSARQTAVDVPFGVGEALTYDVKFGAVSVGTGTMRVLGVEDVRGRRAWHTSFHVEGGTFFYKVNDLMESWFDIETLSSMRFRQQLSEGSRDRLYSYEIFPERGVYVEKGKEHPTVASPLDDGSFMYFVRTLPLVVGETYEFPRYFIPDRNPVTLVVLRRERVKVPAGTFDAIVVRPIIKTKGIFSENGRAELWFSTDSSRILVQMKSRLSFGSLNLYLRELRPGDRTRSP